MTDTTQKPLNAIAHELLTGRTCHWSKSRSEWVVIEPLQPHPDDPTYTNICKQYPVPQYDLTEEEYAELVRLLQQPYYHERTGEILTDPEAIAVDAWFDCDREKWPRVDRVLGVRYLKESYDTYLKDSNARA